jgi:antitoxin FitA
MLYTCEHVGHMSTMIQIRNVPDGLHRRAKAKAALEGVTLSDLALRALEAEVQRLSLDEVADRVRELGPVYGGPRTARLIEEERDSR